MPGRASSSSAAPGDPSPRAMASSPRTPNRATSRTTRRSKATCRRCWRSVTGGRASGICALPVIAQVQGNCLAGGTDLALHCDLVIAADDATIGFPPVRSMGVPPTNMWLYHLGPQWTKRLVLTGDTISGTQARDIGLVVATAPADALDRVVLELAERMALIGRDLLVANKRVVNMGVELMGRSQLQRFAALNDAIGHRAPEAKAFARSRSPRWVCARRSRTGTRPSTPRRAAPAKSRSETSL